MYIHTCVDLQLQNFLRKENNDIKILLITKNMYELSTTPVEKELYRIIINIAIHDMHYTLIIFIDKISIAIFIYHVNFNKLKKNYHTVTNN